MDYKKAKLLLMPLCVLLGTVLLFAFVNYSHTYLSDYFIQNSKSLLGQKLDLSKLAEKLGDSRVVGFSQAHGGTDVTLDTQLVFWSLTCSPCLEKLSSTKIRSNGNLVIPVNVDPETDIEEATATLQKLAPHLNFYHDKDRYLMNTLKVDYLPTYVIIDKKGFIKEILSGPSVEK
ncbi:MAG: TlpA family protein disulfide reductase [Bdellovibrionaceae bacterium]|nr:TlpA family protein disulfide reductase [Pseudobdellovibrionaceae bacterium]